MNVRTQIDEYDDGKNPQFLLFVDGEVEQGLDMNHREVRLTERAAGGETFRIDMQAYTGTLYSEFNLIVELYWLDEEVDGLYYDLQVPLWAFPRMDEDDKTRLDIQTVLNDAVEIPGLDGRKMSKSYGNAISLSPYRPCSTTR